MADSQHTNEFISGEEYQARQQQVHSRPVRQVTISSRPLLALLVVVVFCALSFAAGVTYQKHHTPRGTSAGLAAGMSQGGFGSMRGARRSGGIGQVTAVSSTSITISNERSQTDKTYTINSSTSVTNNNQTASVSDIQTGDTVLISTSASSSSVASRIVINPNFGGGFGGASGNSAPASPDSATNTN